MLNKKIFSCLPAIQILAKNSLSEGSFYTNLSCVHVHNLHPDANLHPRAKLHPGANFDPLASRSYANKSCSYVPRFDLKFNTRYIVLWSNSLCLNVIGDIDPLFTISLRVMCVRDIFIVGCGFKTFTFHSYKSQKKHNTRIIGNKNIRHDCISID